MIRIYLAELMADYSYQRKKRLRIDELADATQINRATLSKLINKPGYNTNLKVIEKLCRFFDVDISDVIKIDDGAGGQHA
jgi:putative transcriptional regulator